jgi:hypothetical protein
VPARIGQRLAQRLERLFRHLGADLAAHARAHPQGGSEAEQRRHLVDHGEDVPAQIRPGIDAAGLQLEDGSPDLLDRLVHGVHGVADPAGHFRPGDHGHGALQRHAGGVEALDDLVVQVAGDPVPVLVQRQPLGLGPAGRELEGDTGLGGERGHHAGLRLGELRRAVAAADGEHPADVARRAQREQDRGPDLAHRRARGPRRPLVVGEIGRDHRLTRGQDLAGQGLAGRQDQAAGGLGAVAVCVADRHPAAVVVGQGQHGQIGAGQLAGAAGDVGQHLAGRGAGQQPGGDLGTGLDPALLAAGGLVEPGVLDRHAGRRAQGDQDRLVVLGELAAAALVGQVQVAEHLVADPDRDAEEAAHGRVAVGKAGRFGMAGDIGQAQRPGVADQQAEQAASLGPVVDAFDLVLGQADRDELGQPLAVADHAQGAVGGVDQPDRGLDDPPQGGFQVQAGADGHHCLEQAAHAVPGGQHGLQPALQFRQELVELQVRQQLRAVVRTWSHPISPSRRRYIARLSGRVTGRQIGLARHVSSS